jgi:hypothetical protein
MSEKRCIFWYRNGWHKLHEDGTIEKPDGYLSDGKTWEFVGLLEKMPFGRYGRLIPREELFNVNTPMPDLKYKNGNYRFNVVDIDHGTRRIWSQ